LLFRVSARRHPVDERAVALGSSSSEPLASNEITGRMSSVLLNIRFSITERSFS